MSARKTPESARSLLRRLGWFVLLWCAGVGTVGALAFVIRLWIT